jgi:hypothetical protein
MSKPTRGSRRSEIVAPAVRQSSALAPAESFDEVLALIDAAKRRAYQAVNKELVGLYWQVGEYISRKLESAQWGEGVVDALAAAIAREHPGLRGFTRQNLFRMRQFFEAYRDEEKVSPLVRQLPWTHHHELYEQLAPAAQGEPSPRDEIRPEPRDDSGRRRKSTRGTSRSGRTTRGDTK